MEMKLKEEKINPKRERRLIMHEPNIMMRRLLI